MMSIPQTFRIANGLAFGFISYTLIRLFSGRQRTVNWLVHNAYGNLYSKVLVPAPVGPAGPELNMALDTRSSVLTFHLNGQAVSVEAVNPQVTLLDYVREQGLTGAKEGCAEGECGACTVVLVKQQGQESAYCPVNSCLMFLSMAAGHEIYTVEALAREGTLHPAQQSMVDQGGSQCGYCTPGFVMSLFAEYYRAGRKNGCEPQALEGNLCRCTGYRPIRDAALSLGPARDDQFRLRLSRPAPVLNGIEYQCSTLKFSRPATLSRCLEALADPQARVVAGGTDLAVESNLRGSRFPHLVSVEAVTELRAFRETPEYVEIGAGLPLGEIGRLWSSAPPQWNEWLSLFASPLIRNRATLGGNLATASPIGDAAPLLLALDAEVRIASFRAERIEPLSSFFVGYRKTRLQPGEVLVSVRVPKPYPSIVRFYKVAKRRLDDISTLAACFALTFGAGGRVRKARFAYGGVGETPERVTEAEEAVQGRFWNDAAAQAASEAVSRTVHPISDHRGSAAYRLAVAQSLIGKFLHQTREETA